MQYTLKMARCSRLLNKHNIVSQHVRGLRLNNSQRQSLQRLLPQKEEFQTRHIGPREWEQTEMLRTVGFKVFMKLMKILILCVNSIYILIFQSLGELTEAAVPAKILHKRDLNIEEPLSEYCINSIKYYGNIFFLLSVRIIWNFNK